MTSLLNLSGYFNESHGCANIGKKERLKRYTIGFVSIAAAVFLFEWFLLIGAYRFWRLFLFIPFFLGILGIHQASQHICVALAVQGKKNLDRVEKRIENADEMSYLKKRGCEILFESFFAAAALTTFCLLFPK